jgi:hypothetical protein
MAAQQGQKKGHQAERREGVRLHEAQDAGITSRTQRGIGLKSDNAWVSCKLSGILSKDRIPPGLHLNLLGSAAPFLPMPPSFFGEPTAFNLTSSHW